MRHTQHRLPGTPELENLGHALGKEILVADTQHLIHDQYVRIGVNRHGKRQTHHHARRVGAQRLVDRIAHPGEVHDLIETGVDLVSV